jgi:DNA topoisomerase-1
MKLVIVESPAKCGKIQGFLGPDYQVVASMGHIRALEESLDAVGLNNDFEPRFEFISEKSKVQKQLKEAAAGKTTIYLAADDDREGEAIAYSVALLLKLPLTTTPRIVFHEITKDAILKAVEKPRRLNMDRIWAQQARSMLDMLIGFTLSPILWTQVARGLSAGRCQTPALKLIAEKERSIKSFKSSSSWKIGGNWSSVSLSPQMAFEAALEDQLEDEESATNYLEIRRDGKRATVISNLVRPWSSAPPDPLITSTLQQQASALFGLSPKSTMQIAQKLYEAGHITYMRTDKAVLSEEAVKEARAVVEGKWGVAYLGDLGKAGKKEAKKSDAKVAGAEDVKAQEAHEAIRPTHLEVEAVEAEGAGPKLYGLIRQRALQSVMAKALGETCKVVFHCEGESEEERLPWSASWKRTTFPGYQIVGWIAALEDEGEGAEGEKDSDKEAWTKATALIPGTVLEWKSLIAQPHETKAPGRFTEATLIRELESHGIGRPSTFSSLLAAVQDRGYAEIKSLPGLSVDLKTYSLVDSGKPLEVKVSKKVLGAEKQKLVPTDLGLQCLSFLETHFGHLFDYKFTSQMENRLDRIEKGQEAWKQVLRDTWASYKDKYTAMSKAPSTEGANNNNPKLKVFSDGLKAVISKKGPLLLTEGATKEATVFHGWPAGVLFQDMTEEMAKAFILKAKEEAGGEIMGQWNGEDVVRRTGKFGPYVKVGAITMSLSPLDSWDQVQEKLEAKKAAVSSGSSGGSGVLRTFKEYEIRTGPYGPYIYKTTLKNRLFASLPKDIKVEALTDTDAAVLYKAGLDAKKKKFQKK